MRCHGEVRLVGHPSRHALGVDKGELGGTFHWHGAWAEGLGYGRKEGTWIQLREDLKCQI